jgi:hypothetical protein
MNTILSQSAHRAQRSGVHETGGTPLDPEQIAAIYRALRKGREESRHEPGAADFYYGEMEMRRRYRPGAQLAINAPRASMADRWILSVYWLVSGYGLRASRALIALAVTIAVMAMALDLWGFRADRGYGDSLLFAVDSSISLLRAPAAELTSTGQVVEIIVRLAGPLFFGLALLSLRGRVKR